MGFTCWTVWKTLYKYYIDTTRRQTTKADNNEKKKKGNLLRGATATSGGRGKVDGNSRKALPTGRDVTTRRSRLKITDYNVRLAGRDFQWEFHEKVVSTENSRNARTAGQVHTCSARAASAGILSTHVLTTSVTWLQRRSGYRF